MQVGKRSKQAGATLAEFVIACVFLLGPILLVTPVIGKMIAGKHNYEEGLRYAAWERTVWFERRPRNAPSAPVKSSAEIANEVQARVFSSRATVIRSDQRDARQRAAPDAIHFRPTLVLQGQGTGRYESWLREREPGNNNQPPIYLGTTQRNGRISGAAAQGVDGVMNALERLTDFEVETRGLYTTELLADLDDVTRYDEFKLPGNNNSQAIDLRIDRERGQNRRLMLLADGWNVSGPEHARRQAGSMVSTQFLNNNAVRSAVRVIGYLFFAKEARDIEFGKVDPEQVPGHRLGRYQ